MYIDKAGNFMDDGRHRGWYLIMARGRGVANWHLRCFARKVIVGHVDFGWAIGEARIYNKAVVVRGDYGNDGCPISLPKEIWEKGLLLPARLNKLWRERRGWNRAGDEEDAIRKWAQGNIERLAPKGASL